MLDNKELIKDSPLVFIIILNWNSFKDTFNCVNLCRRLTYPNFRILLIDNSSTDGSGQKLCKYFSNIEFIQTSNNLGYAKGNNLGIRQAVKAGADFTWILNPDSIVEKTSLGLLVDTMIQNPDVGICGPRIIDGNMGKGLFFEGLNVCNDKNYSVEYNVQEEYAGIIKQALIDVDAVSGCSMLVRANLYYEIGLLCENFFLYYDDVEFCFRARNHGWRTVVCRKSQIIHISDLSKKNSSDWYYMNKNKIVFARTQKKRVAKTVFGLLLSKPIGEHFKKGAFITLTKIFLRRLAVVLSGLLSSIKPIPRIYNENSSHL